MDRISDERLQEIADFNMPCIGGRGTYKHEESRIAAELLQARQIEKGLREQISEYERTNVEGNTEWNLDKVELQELRQEIAMLKEQHRWIPVSEKLPKTDDRYQVLKRDKYTGSLFNSDAFFNTSIGWHVLEAQVEFWFELPSIPSENDKVIK